MTSQDALRQWLVTNGRTARQFAGTLDIAPESISRWFSGRLHPSKVTRLAIEHVTDGAVKHDGWTR